jgi:hypothetical protein
VCVTLVEQRIGKCHADSAAADDQIIRIHARCPGVKSKFGVRADH